MGQKKKFPLTAILRAVCSIIFICSSVISVGMGVGRASEEEHSFPGFAERSALSAPSPTDSEIPSVQSVPTDPEDSEPPDKNDAVGSPIVPVELSLSDGSGEILFKNETEYTFDTSAMLESGYPIEPVGELPSVLILHTHATESYAEESAHTVTDTRSQDPAKNMIAVGEVLTQALSEHGVNTIHCKTMHDAQSYNDSYSLSGQSVEEYLKEYPSIKYILDVHRDAIATGGGGMAKPVIEQNGIPLAQVMLVVGTNQGGADHPGWKTNLCVAIRTQQALIRHLDGFARPINLRTASFNQQHSPGFLLLEIGSCANTLSEAKASARVFAEVFANLILNP